MSSIASKNLYELLGNDPELDPDREPEPPTKVIDKPVQRTGKRNAGTEAPSRDISNAAAGGRGGRQTMLVRGDLAGTLNNRAEQRDDGLRTDRHTNRTREPRDTREARGRGRGRGGRGGRAGAPRDDRHSHSGIGDQEKQAAHGWGGESGNAEWADERAGEAIARAEAKNEAGLSVDANAADPAFANGPGADGEVVAEPEPEDKVKSYDQYLAEQAEKRLALSGGSSLETRKANEGSSQKFPEGKAFSRDPDNENFFIGGAGKTRKAKDVQDKKERVTIDQQYYAPPESGDRGSRGRGRGGRGGPRGEFRGGDSGRGRGRGRGGGDFRGGAPRAERGARGGFNATDEAAFPALGK